MSFNQLLQNFKIVLIVHYNSVIKTMVQEWGCSSALISIITLIHLTVPFLKTQVSAIVLRSLENHVPFKFHCNMYPEVINYYILQAFSKNICLVKMLLYHFYISHDSNRFHISYMWIVLFEYLKLLLNIDIYFSKCIRKHITYIFYEWY